MPKTAQVKFNVTNNAQNVAAPATGIAYFMGPTLMGAPADPSVVISSWNQFRKLYGGLSDTNDFPLVCKRALDKGSKLRVSRVVHYTDPANTATEDGTASVSGDVLKLDLDAVLVTGNVVNITIGGTAIVPVTFDTDHNTTMDLIKNSIIAHPDVTSVEVPNLVSNNLTLLVSTLSTQPTVTGFTVTLGASQAGATNSYILSNINNLSEELFTIVAKYKGSAYNDLRIAISDSSNGQSDSFNFTLYNPSDGNIFEEYTNLTIPSGGATVVDSTFLDDIINNSNYLKVTYLDTTAITGTVNPMRLDSKLENGTDGLAPVLGDYVGDSAAGNGFNAFSDYDDGTFLMAPTIKGFDFHVLASAYVVGRKDIQYNAWAGDSEIYSTVVTNRVGSNINTKFVNFYYGQIEVPHPESGIKTIISPMGDLAGLIATSDNQYGEYYSYAGLRRGVLSDVYRIINNYGSPGKTAELNILSQNQINSFIQRGRNIYLTGNFTSQIADNSEKFTNVVRLVLFLQRSLKPTLASFLEEPNDPATWKKIYYTVLPFLESLSVSRAWDSYEWQGDQNVASIAAAVINDPAQVNAGKYKINLVFVEIVSLQEVEVNLILNGQNGTVSLATT